MSQPVPLGTIRILTINDVYAFQPVQGRGGYAEIATLANKYRTENSIFTINGDFLGGSSLAEFFQGKCVIEVLNAMDINMCVVGNHEFDFGNKELHHRMLESNFDWLGSNVKLTDDPTKLFGTIKDTIIRTYTFQIEGEEHQIKVGFFGVCTLDTPVLSFPDPDVIFEPVLECAKLKVEQLKQQQCDLIICLSHVSYAEDMQIANSIKGITAIFGGHDHHVINEISRSGTLIFKTGQNAYWLGVVDFHLEFIRDTDRKQLICCPSWQMVSNHNNPPKESVLKIIQHWNQEKEKAESTIDKSQPICTVANQVLVTKTGVVRTSCSQFGNLIADSLWKNLFPEVHADMALINGGIVRGDSSYAPGTVITRGMLMDELPFPLTVVIFRLKGKFIKLAIEEHLGKYPSPSGSGLK